MSAALLMMLATVVAGVIIVMIVPLLWARVGGIAGFALGIIAIPAIWFGTIYVAMAVAIPIWGDAVDPNLLPDDTRMVTTGVFALFVAIAAALSALMRRGRK